MHNYEDKLCAEVDALSITFRETTVTTKHLEDYVSKTNAFSNSARRLQIKPIFAVLGLIILSFAAYLNTLPNTFVFDDIYVISGNYFIRDWKNFWGLFTSKYFAASGELSYRPVVTLSYFVDYSLWHLNPMGYHLTNIILHTLNSTILFFLVQRMVRNTPLAFLASLFFACHPVLSEAVNAISYREDLLCCYFLLPPLFCISSCWLPINLCTEPRCFTRSA